MRIVRISSHEIDMVEKVKLRMRWKEPGKKEFLEVLRTAFSQGKELPIDSPTVEVEMLGKSVSLVDLRGIDLQNVMIGAQDLSYCCFDWANLSNSTFSSTDLQYSSFFGANLKGCTFTHAQASPIFARSANFENSKWHDSYFMHCDFENANFNAIAIRKTAMVASNFLNILVSQLCLFDEVDVTEAHFSDSALLRKLFAKSESVNDINWHHSNMVLNEKLERDESIISTSKLKYAEIRESQRRDRRAKNSRVYRMGSPSALTGVVTLVKMRFNEPIVSVRIQSRKRGRSLGFKRIFETVVLKGELTGSFLTVGDVVNIDANSMSYIGRSSEQKFGARLTSHEKIVPTIGKIVNLKRGAKRRY